MRGRKVAGGGIRRGSGGCQWVPMPEDTGDGSSASVGLVGNPLGTRLELEVMTRDNKNFRQEARQGSG